MMTNEEIDELLRTCAENAEQMERARAAYFESEEWRELSALLEREKELEKDLPARARAARLFIGRNEFFRF
jgi:flagellar biosynthesis regulator FlaF